MKKIKTLFLLLWSYSALSASTNTFTEKICTGIGLGLFVGMTAGTTIGCIKGGNLAYNKLSECFPSLQSNTKYGLVGIGLLGTSFTIVQCSEGIDVHSLDLLSLSILCHSMLGSAIAGTYFTIKSSIPERDNLRRFLPIVASAA